MKQDKISKILELHKKWLEGDSCGERALLVAADLSEANFHGVNLHKANLSEANLHRANLSKANLSHANLYGANLSGANLYGANLSGANLYGANLYGADGCYIFTAYDTSKRTVYCIKHKDTWMIQAGCFWGTLDELEAKVKATHNSRVYLANIALLREL